MKYKAMAMVLGWVVGIGAARGGDVGRVVVDLETKGQAVSPLVFGVNTLFMYEDKQVMGEAGFVQLLKGMPVRLMRFPGGDVGDNYYWEGNRLDDVKVWPRVNDPAKSADTDAFMGLCKRVGAEPLMVVNLESGFVHGDIDSAVKRAAAWVRYCNVEKGWGVKYWEIGNETYWYRPGKHKRVRVTAAEYGKAFVRFAEGMKKVDPTIQVGAVGLVDAGKSANNTLADGTKAAVEEPAWWPTVVGEAGKEIDWVSVHAYPGGENQTYEVFAKKGVWGGETIPGLRVFLDKELGRRVPIALTEWNVTAKTPLRGMGLAQAQANLLCRFVGEGVDWACVWPLRLPGKNERGVLSYEGKGAQPLYWVMQILEGALVGGRIVGVESAEPAVFAFGVAREGEVAVVVINKSGEEKRIEMAGVEGKLEGEALAAEGAESTDVKRVKLECEGKEVGVPAYSVGVVKIKMGG